MNWCESTNGKVILRYFLRPLFFCNEISYNYDMSEELNQRGLLENGLRIGGYEYYNIGSVTLNQLRKHKIVPDKEYGEYSNRKPDGLLADRKNKKNIKIIAVVEHKDSGKFKTEKEKTACVQQCNDVCQLVGAEIGIATDGISYIWFNPNQPDPVNNYKDPVGTERSYSLILDEGSNPFIKEFSVDQKVDEEELTKLSPKTRAGLQYIETIRKFISANNSKIVPGTLVDPSTLAKQIWQDVWSVSGATPERCLYTFVEIFIFKYLSDLNILKENDKGDKVNFRDIYSLDAEKAFKNYDQNVRPWLKTMFPASKEDGTTIINGTVLNPSVPEHGKVFHKILKKFNDFGELKNIDPNFKSKVFEDFMKKSISKKNWGQYFTPRNIIDAVIEISGIDKLENGAEICDPACGVGGFLLEPIKLTDEGVGAFYSVKGGDLVPRFNFTGFDKGFEKEEQLTIILAKANMLIFLSELLTKNPTLSTEFSRVFNSTFKLLSNTVLGTLSKTEEEKYDLILTNPPYVTSGSSNYKEAIKNDSRLSHYYRVNGIGVEGLFMEWIIRSLKPNRKAFVIIPDGILHRINDARLREFIKDECIIDGIISLPINAFYTTPKKTYILALTKKYGKTEIERKEQKQTDPVFTYLATNIGETLDVNRFPIEENDLREMVSLFNQFKGAKKTFKSISARCKIQPIDIFEPQEGERWTVDRLWNEEEKVELGIEDEKEVLTVAQFLERIDETKSKMEEIVKGLKQNKS